ncbi:MAG: hypothetical protein RSE93_02975 [Oscillospiraceae bacterium]
MKTEFLTFKGKPLVKNKNIIYYGSMADEFVVMMQILNLVNDYPNDIIVQLIRTAKNISPKDMIVKKAEKKGILEAMEIADIWLSRSLSENK